jgi:hypothetical protein
MKSKHLGADRIAYLLSRLPDTSRMQPSEVTVALGEAYRDGIVHNDQMRGWFHVQRPHLLRMRSDAPEWIGRPCPNTAALKRSVATLRWLRLPSSISSNPTGSPSPRIFMPTSPAINSRSPCQRKATCPAQ